LLKELDEKSEGWISCRREFASHDFYVHMFAVGIVILFGRVSRMDESDPGWDQKYWITEGKRRR
jgi:hypothetical protein